MTDQKPRNNNGEESEKSTNPRSKHSQERLHKGIEKNFQNPKGNFGNFKDWSSGHPLQNGRYIIQGELGQGGMGIAYLTRDTKLNRNVVIKTLNQRVSEKNGYPFEKLQKDFEKEAKRLSQFSHPHIVQIYDTFTDEQTGLICIVMEYIVGETLATRMKKIDFMLEAEALPYICQIANALKALHKKNLVHRDVKPGNIMIRQGSQEAVLIDFGIAREFDLNDPLFQTTYVSMVYAPLEQYYEDKKKGPYTDVYALAATLYELLTNKSPKTAKERSDYKNMDGLDPLSPPKEHNPNISDQVNDAILKSLALSSTDRPQSIQEFLDLLITHSAPSPPPTQRQSRRSNSHPATPKTLKKEIQPISGENKKRSNSAQLSGWTALMGSANWLILSALFPGSSSFRSGLNLWIGIGLCVIALFGILKNRQPSDYKFSQISFALISALFLFGGVLFSDLLQQLTISFWIPFFSLLSGIFASLMLWIFQSIILRFHLDD